MLLYTPFDKISGVDPSKLEKCKHFFMIKSFRHSKINTIEINYCSNVNDLINIVTLIMFFLSSCNVSVDITFK